MLWTPSDRDVMEAEKHHGLIDKEKAAFVVAGCRRTFAVEGDKRRRRKDRKGGVVK